LEIGAIVNAQQYRGSRKEKLVELSPSFFEKPTIDTLYLSVLLFPKKPYHPLVKDYKLDGEEMNNPIADAVLAKELLSDLLVAYQDLPITLQDIYRALLKGIAGFNGFFSQFEQEKGRVSLEGMPSLKPIFKTTQANWHLL